MYPVIVKGIDTLSVEATLIIVFASLLKRVYSERKEFAPLGSKFFPFRIDPFQKRLGLQESKEVTEVFSFVKECGKSTKSSHVPLRKTYLIGC